MIVLDAMVDVVQLVHSIAKSVARHDRDLANQMKRSSSSVALNGSEGVRARAGKRTSRLEDAINSARETVMALRIAKACNYAPAEDAERGLRALDEIIAMLWTLAFRR